MSFDKQNRYYYYFLKQTIFTLSNKRLTLTLFKMIISK